MRDRYFDLRKPRAVDNRTELLESPAAVIATLAASAHGRMVQTLEGLADADDPVTNALRSAFLQHGGLQCGYCTPGMMMAARELLLHETRPDRDTIREALAGNICRCTGYGPIIDAVAAAAAELTP